MRAATQTESCILFVLFIWRKKRETLALAHTHTHTRICLQNIFHIIIAICREYKSDDTIQFTFNHSSNEHANYACFRLLISIHSDHIPPLIHLSRNRYVALCSRMAWHQWTQSNSIQFSRDESNLITYYRIHMYHKLTWPNRLANQRDRTHMNRIDTMRSTAMSDEL